MRVSLLLSVFFAVLFGWSQAEYGVHWTLHSNCYDTPGLSDAMKRAVSMVYYRYMGILSALDQPQDTWSPDLRRVVELFLGADDNFDARLETVLSSYDRISQLDPNPTGRDHRSGQWEYIIGQSDDEKHKNFVIVCAPDIGSRESDGTTTYYDMVRLVSWTDPATQSWTPWMWHAAYPGDRTQIGDVLAFTSHDARDQLDPENLTPLVPDRRRIPQAVYFAPEAIRGLARRTPEFALNTEQRVAEVANVLDQSYVMRMTRDVATDMRGAGKCHMDILAIGLDAVLSHEILHLTQFGMFYDDQDDRAYDWDNQVRYRNVENPEWHLHFTLAIEILLKQGYVVDQTGMLTTPGGGGGEAGGDGGGDGGGRGRRRHGISTSKGKDGKSVVAKKYFAWKRDMTEEE